MGRRIERDFGWLSATALLAALLWSGCAEDAGPERAARARLDGELDGSVESGVDGALMDAGPTARGGGVAEIAAPPPPGCFPQSCTLPSGCPGRRTCTNGTYLGPCMPLSTTTDTTCNGLDDNCNGMIDEGATAASCNDGLSCTIDSCNMTTHACVNQPFGLLCTAGISDCTIGICTNAAGVSNAEFAFTASDPLVVPTGVPAATGCTYRARNNWCTNTYDSCNCNGPEICVARPRLAAGGISGCVSAPFALAGTPAPTILDPCDSDGIACTREQVCCEPPDGGYCRTDTLQNQANPFLYQRRIDACRAGGTDAWPAVVAGFPALGNGTLAARSVVCSPLNPFGAGAPYTNRCQNEGNPCTTITCNETAGGVCTVTNRPTVGAPETFFDATGALVTSGGCTGDVPGTYGCSSYLCNGTATCSAVPRADMSRTLYCDVDTSTDDARYCGYPRCVAGLCSPNAGYPPRSGPDPDPEACPIYPSSCGAGVRGFCSTATPLSPEWPDLPNGCGGPVGYCYIAGANGSNGTLDGYCVPNGTVDPTDGCRRCDAFANSLGWTPQNVGGPCTSDLNECTDDLCSAAGTCQHPCNPSLTDCERACDVD